MIVLRKIKPSKIFFGIFRYLLIFGMSYVFLFPILYFISVALRDPSSVTDPSVVWVPKALSLDSLKVSIDTLQFFPSVFLTLTISILSTVGSLISCSLIGYGLARFRFFENKLIFALVFLTIIVPPQTILISSYLNFRFFDFGGLLFLFKGITGVANINLTEMPLTPLTFILPSFFGMGLRAGLFSFIFRQFFKGIPKELEEAASLDGCGYLKTFGVIVVPLAKPAFITVLLFSFIWHWNDFYTSAMYFVGELKPISVMLNNLVELLGNKGLIMENLAPFQLRTYLAAGSFLTMLPPLIVYIFAQKHFTESIERVGIVG